MKIKLSEAQLRLVIEQTLDEIDTEAGNVDRNPTEAQIKAGNYKMGHIRFGGFAISIENPKGSKRTFKNEDGSTGSVTMKNHYGYFLKAVGKDGDLIDVFIGDTENFQKVYVVDQNNEKGEFDESKVMLGFKSAKQAKKAYLSNYSPDWTGFRSITGVSIPFFKKWLYRKHRQRKPFADYAQVKKKQLIQLLAEMATHKIGLDKYYTPDDVATHCIEMFKEYADKKGLKITQYVEPSAGNGAFSNQLDNCLAFDIKPEHDGIHKADFLTLDLPYKEGRCIIGNPPYGEKGYLVRQFLKKASTMGDYIAFILPMSQLNNNHALNDFDLVNSVSLGDVLYSGEKNVGTCFNIYVRGEKKKRTRQSLKDVTIIRSDNKNYDNIDADLRIGGWGNSVAGRILEPDERKYAAEYKIIVNNKALKNKVIDVLTNADWRAETNSYAMLKIQAFHIINLLKREIPEIQ